MSVATHQMQFLLFVTLCSWHHLWPNYGSQPEPVHCVGSGWTGRNCFQTLY